MWYSDREWGCMLWTLAALLMTAGAIAFKVLEFLAEHLRFGWR